MPPHSLDVAIVADDLTGALDTGAPFASLGFSTSVFFDQEQGHLSIPSETQVLSINSDSRHLSPGAAEEQVRIAIAAALGQRPRILFKKIDSTLRGNVAVEILASMHASCRRHALIAPAVPSQLRVVKYSFMAFRSGKRRLRQIVHHHLVRPYRMCSLAPRIL